MGFLIVIAQGGGLGETASTADHLAALITVLKYILSEKIPQLILPIFVSVLVLIIVWAGIQYITGGPQGGENAKKTIIAAVIGAVIVALAWMIVYNIVVNIIGGNIL